jgi:hypothetical protein
MCEQETFWSLLHSPGHWIFEIFLMLLFDGVIGIFLIPTFRKKILHHKSDDNRIEELEKRVKELQNKVR